MLQIEGKRWDAGWLGWLTVMVIAGRISHAFGIAFVVLEVLLAVFHECSIEDFLLVDVPVGKLVQETRLGLAVP
jgi:hypothetical protein